LTDAAHQSFPWSIACTGGAFFGTSHSSTSMIRRRDRRRRLRTEPRLLHHDRDERTAGRSR